MKNPRVARRYAHALMQVAEEKQAVDEASESLALVAGTVGASRDLRLLLASPIVAEGRKASVMRVLFERRIDRLSMEFIGLLIRKHREVYLGEVIAQFHALRDELQNVVTVDVVAAVPLLPEQEQTLRRELEQRTGKHVRLRLTSDPAIMGGLVVRIGDTVLDASVAHQLVRLRGQLAGTAG